MVSPGHMRWACGHLMAAFDAHSHCAHRHKKSKGNDPFVMQKDCPHCNVLTTDQRAQFATPPYKIKKKERDSKSGKSDNKEDNSILIHLSSVTV